MCFAPQRRALFPTSQLPKVLRTGRALTLFTSKCASRHNGVRFSNTSTPKSGSDLRCFVHFPHRNFVRTDVLQMCLAPQRRALFRHLNSQKWLGAEVFCTFSLRNVLRATTACTFSTSQLPKVVRDRRVLPLFTSKCASRHNGVHFSNISTSKSAPNPNTCFDTFYFQMCFAPQRRALFQHLNFQKSSETGVFCTFYFKMCFAPQRRACNFCAFSLPCLRAKSTFSTSQRPKVVRDMTVFDTFDLEMCFAPQRRAIFHLSSGQPPHPPL